MKFSIITPTYKRAEKLTRAVTSLLNQTYKDWELIIINDSPTDTSYEPFVTSINDSRIHYHVNNINKGVNFSRNYGLSKLSADSKWVVFLDDDDYLAPDALSTLNDLILLNPKEKWFLTNRAKVNGEPLTQFPRSDSTYRYAFDYLITKRCKGDATHCIETKLITHSKATFSNYVKQGEEWFFFYQIGLNTKIYYHDHNSTITDGYDHVSGLNFRKRTFRNNYESLSKLLYEGFQKKLINKPTFIVYCALRLMKLLVL